MKLCASFSGPLCIMGPIHGRLHTTAHTFNGQIPGLDGITLCLKKNNVFSYNSRKHWQIFIIFGRNVTEKAGSHMLLYFSTSPN